MLGIAVEFVAGRIRPAAPLHGLELIDHFLPRGGGGIDALREPEVTGIAHARPGRAPGILQRPERPLAFFGLKFAAALMLNGHDQAGSAQLASPDHSGGLVRGAVVMLVGRNRFNAREIPSGHEIDDPGHRVGPVDSAGTFLQHLNALHSQRRQYAQVHETPADQPGRQIGLAAIVEQHQGSRGSQSPEVHIGDAFGNGRRQAGVVPGRPLAHHAVAGPEVLEQVHDQRRAALRQGVAVQHIHGVGSVDGRAANCRAHHHDFLNDGGGLVRFLGGRLENRHKSGDASARNNARNESV